ncbi:MAG: TlpA family protein disulfide reductase [Bdellovibrio bacteriovorus]
MPTTKPLRWTLAAALLALGAAGLARAEPAAGDQTLTPITDRPAAPDFDLKDPEDRPQRLADYRGKAVILNFWATWCPPCREEMPSMQRAHEAVSDDGIAVVAINVGEDADTILQFLSNYPVEFPLPMDLDSQVVQSYPVKGLPTTFVIDPEGRLAYVATGGREWDDPKLLDQVRALRN